MCRLPLEWAELTFCLQGQNLKKVWLHGGLASRSLGEA